jgi:adenylylsulfate kinase
LELTCHIDFTGVSSDAPYEVPDKPELHIKTDSATIEEGVQQIVTYLLENKLITL